MKLIVFGATGGVGKSFVQQAVEKGHEVTTFVRTPAKMDIKGVEIIQGDAFDAKAVAEAIVGKDAVVSCLGSTNGPGKDTSIGRMGHNIADGMKAAGVKRILYCASAGIDGEIPGLIGKMIMKMLAKPLKDHKAALSYILANDVVYTIARPYSLKDKPLENDYSEAFEGVPTSSQSIPRASVAHFLLKALDDEKYNNASVALASKKK
ncbi:MAG: SDR family oxidoreductase [Kurthia sp.]|nr:SDR family oxidoreductase [Candidatus Kurthia equi]